jgi:hypothetical protein
MPGQRHSGRPRTQGSWGPRLAGLAVIVIVALAGTVAYLLAFHPGTSNSPASLPSHVASTQTVGLLAQAGAAPSQDSQDSSMIQLLSSRRLASFVPVDLAQQQDGQPEWIADTMAGGSYIFIYLPNSQCLGSAGTQLALQRCNLGSRQRWRRVGNGVSEDGHIFYQYANLADGKCISRADSAGGGTYSAGLAACGSHPASQLLAFWWTAD